MTYFSRPRIVGITHGDVDPSAIHAAIDHALAAPVDRCSGITGAYLSFDGQGRPIDIDDPDAEIIETIVLEVQYAR